MPHDILRDYGPDSPANQMPRAKSGGEKSAKALPYDPPEGPIGIMGNNHPGLGGSNHGCGTNGKH